MGYILFYFLNSLLAINHEKIKHIKYLDFLIFFSIIFFASIRGGIGGDWFRYVAYYDKVLPGKDPQVDILFYSINALLNLLNFEILGRNIVLIILFIFPFYYVFKKSYHNIYLALCIFFPIIFLVYGLGSVRQGLAISYFFLFLYYNENKVIKYLLFFVPFFFHTSSIFILIFYFGSQVLAFNNLKKLIFFIIIFFIISLIILFYQYDYFYEKFDNYILKDTYFSIGAPVRAILLSMFSLLFLYKLKNLNILDYKIKNFLFFSSLLILFLTPFSFFVSTPVDRILGFFLITKLMISEEIMRSTKNELQKKLFSTIFIFIGFVYLVTWIYFGENSYMWNRFDLFF